MVDYPTKNSQRKHLKQQDFTLVVLNQMMRRCKRTRIRSLRRTSRMLGRLLRIEDRHETSSEVGIVNTVNPKAPACTDCHPPQEPESLA
jgi:hypothetical protein